MLQLRAALLEVSGLDERTEPVPLLVADPVAAVISLAMYMDGLLQRAARMTGDVAPWTWQQRPRRSSLTRPLRRGCPIRGACRF